MCCGKFLVLQLSFLKLNDVIIFKKTLDLCGEIVGEISAKLDKLLVSYFKLALTLVVLIRQ